jgi:hypothetical protein
MMITLIKVVVLFCFLIIPLRGPAKRRDNNRQRSEKMITCSNYGINERGELEEIFNKNGDDKEKLL